MVLGALSLALAGLLEVLAWRGHANQSWYRGRAAAESAKTLAWRYAVGGHPFTIATESSEADEQLVGRFAEIADAVDLGGVVIRPASDEVTGWMRDTRSASLDRRRAIYRSERLLSQADWYSAKASVNIMLRTRWTAVFVLMAVLGAVAAVINASSPMDIDLLGLFASAGLAIIAWRATKNHGDLAEAYDVTGGELRACIASMDDLGDDEESWAAFVDSSEHAISREHTMWTATRSDR
jgi:hypothetical protein